MRQIGFVFALIAATLTAQTPDPVKAGLDPERLGRIADRLKAFVAEKEVAGAVALVARHGAIGSLDAAGVQDIETGAPMRADSIFQIMSMTKPVTAVGIMILVEEGKLRLTDTVEKHLPEFRGQMMIEKREDGRTVLKKPARAITIRDLLTHTSGMVGPAPALDGLYQKMDRTLAEAVAVFAQNPVEFEPGSRWLYSNTGIATLGRLIEVASGKSYESFLDERIFKPLGMKDSFFFPPAEKKARIATVHQLRDGKLTRAGGEILGGVSWQHRPGAKYPAPEFGLYSTATDLFAFYDMMRNGGLRGGTRILSPASVRVMTSLHTAGLKSGHMPGTGFGLGWEVVTEPMGELALLSQGTFGHGGAFGTHGWIDPKKDLVGVLLIQNAGGNNTVKYAVMAMAGAAVLDK